LEKHLETAKCIAARCAELEIVEAVALSGSTITGLSSESSDIDIYVYTSREISLTERDILSSVDSEGRQIIDYWGPGDAWFDTRSGVEVDVIYWPCAWIEEQISRTLDRCEAWAGYTTAFWHTIKVSQPLYDRNGWFAKLQAKAQSPYPDALVKNIVQHNFPMLRQIIPSYRNQIEKAIQRQDWLSINHRVTWVFASYFDIIFAVNRLPHKGEKRQMAIALQCQKLPANFQANVEAVLQDAGKFDASILQSLDRLVDELELWLKAEGFSEA
jgi:hypothetical protein